MAQCCFLSLVDNVMFLGGRMEVAQSHSPPFAFWLAMRKPRPQLRYLNDSVVVVSCQFAHMFSFRGFLNAHSAKGALLLVFGK